MTKQVAMWLLSQHEDYAQQEKCGRFFAKFSGSFPPHPFVRASYEGCLYHCVHTGIIKNPIAMHVHDQQLSAFQAFVAKKVSLTHDEWQRTVQSLETIRLTANSLLLKEGQVCEYLYFVNQGLMRFFVIGADGKDTTKFFTPEHQLFSSQQSFATQTPRNDEIISE